MSKDKNEELEPPNIFRAARNDDPDELAAALKDGQTLDECDYTTMQTPIHVACTRRSLAFLESALEMDFDPWVRDKQQRLPIDYAHAEGLTAVQERLLQRMYPSGWENDPVVKL